MEKVGGIWKIEEFLQIYLFFAKKPHFLSNQMSRATKTFHLAFCPHLFFVKNLEKFVDFCPKKENVDECESK